MSNFPNMETAALGFLAKRLLRQSRPVGSLTLPSLTQPGTDRDSSARTNIYLQYPGLILTGIAIAQMVLTVIKTTKEPVYLPNKQV